MGPRLFYGWILVTTLGVTTVVSYGTTIYLFGVLVLPLEHDLGGGRGVISGAYALSYVVAGLLGIPVGRLVDRLGARLLMTLGSAIASLSLIMLSQIHAVWQLYALWAGGLGVATSLTLYPVSFTVVANWFERRRGTALAILTLVGGLASPICIPLAGWLVTQVGWRETVFLLGFAQLTIALPLHALVVRRRPEDLGMSPDGDDAMRRTVAPILSGLAVRQALTSTAFWTLTAASSFSLLGSTAVTTHQIASLIGRGYDGVFAATVAGLVGLTSLPGRFILNVVSDRVGPQRLLAICFGVQGLGIVLLANALSMAWLVAYVFVYGAAFGAISPLRASTMAQQFGRREYGAIFAAQGFPVALCAGGGPLLAGWLFDVRHDYTLAFVLAAAACFIGGVGVALTPAPKRHSAT